ncbi:B-cell receptor CD22-like isoform X2 [Hyla sarda]|uniref:B-cell receptor CD22-like isoform X2 n=1 Tax=Hyla sarda TaxID=327740 RepID=UPI0024C260C1|nr:B-cell receptor CD22-like isoform X2 [Hyla sarda]
MDNLPPQRTLTFLFLVLFFKAVFSEQDSHVQLASSVTGWEGSCAVLPCEIIYNHDIDYYMWFYNPVFDKTTSDYKGTIVYHSTKMEEVDSSFIDRVEHIGMTVKNCTILIKNLQKNDTGHYKLRKIWKDNKWMSKQELSLTVSETAPELKLHEVPKMQENKEVTLTCSIDYFCPSNAVNFTWLADVNRKVTTTDVRNDISTTRTTTSLTFVPSWEDNNKMISCVLDRMNREKENKIIQLDVKHAPKNVTIIPQSPIIRIKEGNNVTLKCSVESSNPPEVAITWYKNGGKMQGTDAREKLFKESGRYQCEAKNSAGSNKSNTVEISVLHLPKSVSIQKPEGNIREGSLVTLSCSTVANPPVSRYIWYKNKREFFNSTDSRYAFRHITENDSGSYQCEAVNSQGKGISAPEQLDVKYAPKNVKVVVKPDGKQFLEGKSVSFECVVKSSNPNVTKIKWKKNDKSVTVSIGNKSIEAADAGTYTCEATNEIGTSSSDAVTVEVHYKPKYSDCKINEKNKKEHDELILKCPSRKSNPDITSYEWFKSDELYSTTTSDSIKITNLKLTDSGYYSCRAINPIGRGPKAECEYIWIHYAPKNVTVGVSPGNYVTENTDVRLNCTAKANPAIHRYSWYHNKKPLQTSQKEYVIVNIQLSHMGEYYCIVDNTIGSNTSQVIYLHVSYSFYTIAIYTAAAIIPFIILILIVVLIIRFRICMKTLRKRKTTPKMTFTTLSLPT